MKALIKNKFVNKNLDKDSVYLEKNVQGGL